MSENQIFQTNNPVRWQSVKWSGRLILFLICFLFTVAVIAIVRGTAPDLPDIESRDRIYDDKSGSKISSEFFADRKSKYKGFKAFLSSKEREERNAKPIAKNFEPIPFIRAAFYDPSWSYAVSLSDLQENAAQLNMIFPLWFILDKNPELHIQSKIDTAGLAEMQKHNLRIIPILSNWNSAKNDFDGSIIHDLLNDEKKQKIFIDVLADSLLHYGFAGINIDFEEINEKTPELLNRFQLNLYNSFHAKNLLVTQDVVPDDDNYDFKTLNLYNDYIVLMAYDQHSSVQSGPGPISGQKWIEEMLDKAAGHLDNKKIILGIAGYGYDWSTDEEGKPLTDNNGKVIEPDPVTYSQALDKANVSGSKVIFDNDNFNLHYSYREQKNDETILHTVWFTGAGTTYNILRFSDEYSTAGTALWALGKEDRRIWNFYHRDLSNTGLEKNPFAYDSLKVLPFDINQRPTSIGEDGGELLRIIHTPTTGKVAIQIDTAEQLITEQEFLQLPSGYVYEKFGEDTTEIGNPKNLKKHKLILTFDDGPDPYFTPKILDILEREKVPATFFIVGINAEKNIPLLQRIYKNGYEIGNHTFTHNNIARMSPQRADLELKTTRLLIEAVTGHSTILFRAPYNADSQPQSFEEIEPIARSQKDNYITVGEAIDPNDWDDQHVNGDTIFNRVVRQAEAENSNIILLHDAGGNTRQATVDALPRIIQYFKGRGCEFTTIGDLMGKPTNVIMPPVTRDWKLRFNFYFTMMMYWGMRVLFAMFLVGIAMSMIRITAISLMAWIQKNKEMKLPVSVEKPGVSIIVPAFNEEVNAVRTVQSLLQQDYPNLQIVFVDDGSKDNTFSVVSEFFADYNNVLVVTKTNGGKATALNYGINLAINEYVVCIDADTQLKNDAVTRLMEKFIPGKRETVAVSGNVKVGNEINLITRWQSIEYTTSQNFDRAAFDLLNCMTVIPGAIGAFKKQAIIEAGGFTADTLAEDCDLTMRLQKNGYRIRNCRSAISFTEAPESFRQFLKQRFRWSFGVMQSFWKHRTAFLNPRYGNFGMIAMPNIFIFQMILPALAPMADLVMVLSLISAALGIIPISVSHIALYYLVFSAIDILGGLMAFSLENSSLKQYRIVGGNLKRESYWKLLWLLPQQIIYRQLMYYILIKSVSRALKGELQGWGILKRTGNVKQPAAI